MRVIGVIPARMGSSRFPGKPLVAIGGRPMIEHVYRGTVACALVDEVVVATCDAEIARAAAGFGARVIMTSAAHERASDRVAEACERLEADVAVMVQGDEPMVQPGMIAATAQPLLENPRIDCVNLAASIRTETESLDPNTIKVVISRSGQAMYFSRRAIPAGVVPGEMFKQVCVIGFRRHSLRQFARLPQGPLERAESIDMLRFLENDRPVHMVITPVQTQAVDTPDDRDRVAVLMGLD